MFVLLFLLCPGANPLNLSAKTRYSPTLPHSHPGWHAWNAAARAQHRPPASPAGWHAHTYPEFITLINFAIVHNCAPALTGIISRLRTRLRTPISSVAKYSLRVSIALKKIIKAQWSSVGTVYAHVHAQTYTYRHAYCYTHTRAIESATRTRTHTQHTQHTRTKPRP